MTIIRPTQVKRSLRFIFLIFLAVLVSGIFYVLEYNSFVSARYQASSLKKQLADANAANTDLKSRLFKMTDPVQLAALASKYDLTLERKPQYLNQNQWVSVSSYSQ